MRNDVGNGSDWNTVESATLPESESIWDGVLALPILEDVSIWSDLPRDRQADLTLKRPGMQSLALALRDFTRLVVDDGIIKTGMPEISIVRSDHEAQPIYCALEPALWITVQGTIAAVVGEQSYVCSAGEAFITTDKLSSSCTVRVAGPTKPFLGLVIEFSRGYTRELADTQKLPSDAAPSGTSDITVVQLTPELQDCVLRLVRLLETPEAITALYPGILREIGYRLLRIPGGRRILGLLTTAGHDRRIVQALKHFQESFGDQICVEQLALTVGMSPASFHRHFKEITDTSPLQYLKRLRLLEARRLMIAGDSNVKGVAYAVGYTSASHFSREYTKMFGKPPRRDLLVREDS